MPLFKENNFEFALQRHFWGEFLHDKWLQLSQDHETVAKCSHISEIKLCMGTTANLICIP